MMNPNNGSYSQQAGPDLASILRVLSQSRPSASSAHQATAQVQQGPSQVEAVVRVSEEYDPSQFTPFPDSNHISKKAALSTQIQPASAALHPSDSSSSKSASLPGTASALPSAAATAPRPKDASTITTWPAALRHVTRLIAHDARALEHISKLRRSQAEHERQWWAGREALLATQNARGAGRARIEAILKGVGGTVNAAVQGPSPEEDAEELRRYDAKIYRALLAMDRSMRDELGAIGIPFFCIDENCIGPEATAKEDSIGQGASARGDGKISSTALREMRLRMIETLEDLSGD